MVIHLAYMSITFSINQVFTSYKLKLRFMCIYTLYAGDVFVTHWNCQGPTVSVHYSVSHILPWVDRRNSRGNDLRDKLEKKKSELNRYSPGRDVRDLHGGLSPSRPMKRRKYRTLEHTNGQGDFSGSFKVSDGTGSQGKDRKLSSDSTIMLADKLKQVQYEVDVLFDHRSRLEFEVEERIQESDILSSKIKDLEVQLSEEKDKCERVQSNIKKLVKAHVLHTRLQEDLKRSQIQVDRLVQDLDLHSVQRIAAEHDSNINIISDEEVPEKEKGCTYSPKKQRDLGVKDTKKSHSAHFAKGNNTIAVGPSQRNSHVQFRSQRENEIGGKRASTSRLRTNEGKSKRRKNSNGSASSDKRSKAVETSAVAPPTSMAAHADDDFIELMEAEEKAEVVGTPAMVENGFLSPLPPLPSVSQNNYTEYQTDDEDVDVDGLQELEEVDIV